MKIYILTLFPELFECYIKSGLVAKACENGLLEFHFINYRDFTDDPHRTVDDLPYGGGAGMVIKPEPVIKAFLSIPEEEREKAMRIIPSARGALFDQSWAEKMSRAETLIFFAARYKGFDQRISELMDATELSIGDYILQGGELPTMVMIDAAIRLVPGFLGDKDSAATDSFSDVSRILSAPDYTRPQEFMGKKVPDVLLSGNHEAIRRWRRREGIKLTMERRPDLIKLSKLTDEDIEFINELRDWIKERLREKENRAE